MLIGREEFNERPHPSLSYLSIELEADVRWKAMTRK